MGIKMQIETVKTDTFSMDFFRFGHGNDTLVILPGLSVQSVMIFADAVADAYQVLAGDYTVYVMDRRKELPAGYSIRDMASDTAEALRALGLDRVSLMGASQGGMIAMVMAAEETDLVQDLILCSSSACVSDEQYKTFEKWIRLAEEGKAEDLYLAFGKALYPEEMFEKSRPLLTDAAKSVTRDDLERFIVLTESIKGFDATEDLGKIRCPIFVAGSDDDRVLGADAAYKITEGLKRSADPVLHMYDGYGHAVYDTAPDLKERILRFLKTVSA